MPGLLERFFRRRLPGLAVLLLATLSACGDRDAGTDELDADAILEEAAERMGSVDGFAFVLEHENGTTTIVRGLSMERASGRVSGGDRMEAEIRTRAGPINVNLRVIVLPEGGWLTNPFTGQWESEALSLFGVFDPGSGVTALLRDLDDAVLVGRENVGGNPTHRIDASVPSGALWALVPQAVPGRTLTVRTWIGVEDSLVHRVEIVGALEAEDAESVVRRITLSEFGTQTAIEAPVP